jgi:endonuclease/exonuclease/phosphatase family metal-dependent hydrolase
MTGSGYQRSDTIRVLSYNIHKGIGGRDRRYRLERIIHVIQAENPDIVCLQEVDRNVARSYHDDQPRLLAEFLEMPYQLYQLNVHLKEGGYGNLILSRFPLEQTHQISLTWRNGVRTKKPRGAQIVVADTPQGGFHIVNWHLGLAEYEREWQANHLLEHRLFREGADLPSLIIGDFNDWRNCLPFGSLGRHGFQQCTAPISRYRSFPAYLPVGSLDKAFCRGAIDVRHAAIVKARVARAASDHLPLVMDVALNQPASGLASGAA